MALIIEYKPIASILPYAGNARTHPEDQIQALKRSILAHGFIVPVLLDAAGTLIAGHGRIVAAKAAGLAEVPTITVDGLTPDQVRAFRLADNALATRATWDNDLLKQELAGLKSAGIDLELTGFSGSELSALIDVATDPKQRTLQDRFLVPPFSVLDARQSYWQTRKREWLDLGIDSQIGWNGLDEYTGEQHSRLTFANSTGTDDVTKRIQAAGGVSTFDPVLCELAYRWLCPPSGIIIDPFAGGATSGIVASRLGYRFRGIELRAAQVEANRQQAEAICRPTDPKPQWKHGAAQDILSLVPAGTQADLILSCPPYADLVKYSTDPRDLSAVKYDQFVEQYRQIVGDTCALLADNRFAFIVIGDVRDNQGFYRGLVGETVRAFEHAGLHLYNQAILVTMLGSLPIRTGTQFMKSRKLGQAHQEALIFYKGSIETFKSEWQMKTVHQNLLVFAKGCPKTATAAIGEVDSGPLIQPEPEAEAA